MVFSLNQRNATADYLGELNIILDATTVKIHVKDSPDALAIFRQADYVPILLEGIVKRLDQTIPVLIRLSEPNA